ncbi:MAG: alpha/beta hydrolase fold domain-containing protein [Candidatus Latescibacteria bacterium]|nr:alpha/beta hydrolase fold domain-containing protein [Candidatus Latescibacterota bacterium]
MILLKQHIVLVFFAFLLVSSIHAGENYEPDRIVVYKTGESYELRLHIFNPTQHTENDHRPAIVFFFGGGWVGGTPTQFYPYCRYLTSRGMVAVSAEYRIENTHGTTPYECVKDGKSAVRWLRSHAAVLGIDPDRIAAGGGSAGGHVAAATGTVKGFEEAGEDTTVSSKPNALVLFNPVFDNSPEGYDYDRVKKHWRDFSPMHNIDENTPPTIVFLGTKDELIPVTTAGKYKSLMEKYGVRCDLFLYEGQPHGFFNHPFFRGTSYEYFNKTCIEMDRFLKSLGYFEGEPELD